MKTSARRSSSPPYLTPDQEVQARLLARCPPGTPVTTSLAVATARLIALRHEATVARRERLQALEAEQPPRLAIGIIDPDVRQAIVDELERRRPRWRPPLMIPIPR